MASRSVVIVGSGVAGATVAQSALDNGLGPVTMLEAGPRIAMAERRHWLDYLTTSALPYDMCVDARDDGASSAAANAWLHGSRVLARGGSTLHWGGWAPRLRPEDFALRSATGRGADWPFGYDELEPWYGAAEHLLGVGGSPADAAEPRSRPPPYGPWPYTRLDGEVIRGLEALGYGYAPMPMARNIEPRAGRPACQTIGTCRYCPLGARYTADQALDLLETRPDFELRTGVAAERITMGGPQRAAGVEYVDLATGAAGRVEADLVILCAGAVETPKLLLNSATPEWPAGIGNASGHLGQHLASHPLLYARGGRAANPQRLQHELDFPTLCSRHFDTAREQAEGKLFLFLPPVHPRVDLAALMRAGQSVADMRRAVAGPLSLELQGFMEVVPGPDDHVGPTRRRNRFGLPGTTLRQQPPAGNDPALRRSLERMQQVLAAAGYQDLAAGVYPARGDHASGTCRMAASDADGVVDADLRVHGTDNLYVVSNAVFPSLGAVNPTLTLTALALRFAARLSRAATAGGQAAPEPTP